MPIANWYPDPADSLRVRWWDGDAWTEHTQPRPAPVVAAAVPVPSVAPHYAEPPAPTAPMYQQPTHQQPTHQQPAYQQATHQQPTHQQAVLQQPGYQQPGYQQPGYQQPGYQQQYAGMPGSPRPGYAVEGSPVQLVAGKAAVPVVAIDYGWVPTTCTRHHRPATATRKVTFVSAIPGWTYALLLLGFLLFVIVASIQRKKATARAWPLCDECLATRRRSMLLVWVGLGGIIPLLWFASVVDGGHGSAVAGMLMLVALVGGPLLAAAGAILGAWPRIVGGTVTRDGLFVEFRPEALRAQAGRAPAGGHEGSSAILPS